MFVEVADLIGKEKKKWQNKLGNQAVPKFIASLVFVGGGRPKAEKVTEDFAKNANLVQWLNKRNIDVATFEKLLGDKLPPKVLPVEGEETYGQDYTSTASFTNLALASPGGLPLHRGPRKEGGGLGNGVSALQYPGPGAGGGWGHHATGGAKGGAFANPIMRQVTKISSVLRRVRLAVWQAEDLTQRTMLLQSPEDPEVTNLIQVKSSRQYSRHRVVQCSLVCKQLSDSSLAGRCRGTAGPVPVQDPH